MSAAATLVAELTARGLTLACAESLTGGMLTARIVDVPGASIVLRGGIVAYATPLKHSLLGVDADLLARRGAVDAEVARQMADGVRRAAAIDGRAADLGIATTGAAGPDAQDGQEPGTVYVGIASVAGIRSLAFHFAGGRAEVREQAVAAALDAAVAELAVLDRSI
ncbi:nicotinamide-nucleotide amidohydrolase family protein [Agromyces seonyuensis]|uniref:Nicotinamide-nucleotide amidohydrolase family protein n=1 Tax=Agromyces seonyuensis TaxID=2662446 RepID=A0A6I4NYV4_9MICO|nr:nicotinamide-nucleotide amidohydrolase family protein [Agromyces seonyuensis]